jgi:hypothetical protein
VTELVGSKRRASTTRRHFAASVAKTGGLSGKIRPMCWERLAEAVRDRRRVLKLTQPDVTERGGPSIGTIRGIETGRSGRLSQRSRRALERALEWERGSVDDVLAGRRPRPLGSADMASAGPVARDAVAVERFAVAQRVIEMKQTFARHREAMAGPAREALEEEIRRSAREVEEAIIKMLPWLSDEERGRAIRILTALRE